MVASQGRFSPLLDEVRPAPCQMSLTTASYCDHPGLLAFAIGYCFLDEMAFLVREIEEPFVTPFTGRYSTLIGLFEQLATFVRCLSRQCHL